MSDNFHRSLLPLAALYGLGVRLRNRLYDCGWKKSCAHNIPIICIGNLAVGGTGKTPHTEMLIRLLTSASYNVAVLSRGYKRQTQGFVLADADSTARDIGDEPFQMYLKFPEVRVAVCADRNEGVERLMALTHPQVDVILLDDAFQHRRIKAGLNILLTEYHRLYTDDWLLPVGRLREPAEGALRAHIIVVTKCPAKVLPMERRILLKKLHPRPYQKSYMTTFRYGELYPLFVPDASLPQQPEVLLLTGIARPQPLAEYIGKKARRVVSVNFPDHHAFTADDVETIRKKYLSLPPERRILVTTEKDAARLRLVDGLSEEMRTHIWVQPVDVELMNGRSSEFNYKILDYVRRNKRNGAVD